MNTYIYINHVSWEFLETQGTARWSLQGCDRDVQRSATAWAVGLVALLVAVSRYRNMMKLHEENQVGRIHEKPANKFRTCKLGTRKNDYIYIYIHLICTLYMLDKF